MRELAVQMDTVYIQTKTATMAVEINALLAEIDKIAANTRFSHVAFHRWFL